MTACFRECVTRGASKSALNRGLATQLHRFVSASSASLLQSHIGQGLEDGDVGARASAAGGACMLNQVVEYRNGQLDAVYAALAHPVRRTLLEHLRPAGAKVTDLAAPFPMSLAAVSKHIRVLESAGLIQRTIRGREHQLVLEPSPLMSAADWLDSYRRFWEGAA